MYSCTTGHFEATKYDKTKTPEAAVLADKIAHTQNGYHMKTNLEHYRCINTLGRREK